MARIEDNVNWKSISEQFYSIEVAIWNVKNYPHDGLWGCLEYAYKILVMRYLNKTLK